MTSSENTDFERRIKSSLEDYEVEYTPADWSEMELKLNTLPAVSTGFQWTFSMNIYLALFVSTALFFLIYKASSHSNISPAEVPGHIIVKEATPAPVRQIQGPVQRNYNPPVLTTEPVKPSGDSSAASASLSSVQPNSAADVDYRMKPAIQPAKTSASPAAVKNSGEAQASPAAVSPDDPSRIRIYGDMIDPKQGMIYNTKETLGGAPLNAQTSHSAVTWSDDGADAKKTTADSLKAILTPEVKPGGTQTSQAKSDKRSRRLFRGKESVQEQKAANEQGQGKSAEAKQEPVPETNKEDKAPADLPQQP